MLVTEFAKPGESIEDVVMRYIRDHDAEPAYRYLEEMVLTEDSTDMALDWAKRKLSKFRMKVWKFSVPLPLGLARRFLDAMLPEKLLEMIREIMVKKGLLNERRLHAANPFK